MSYVHKSPGDGQDNTLSNHLTPATTTRAVCLPLVDSGVYLYSVLQLIVTEGNYYSTLWRAAGLGQLVDCYNTVASSFTAMLVTLTTIYVVNKPTPLDPQLN